MHISALRAALRDRPFWRETVRLALPVTLQTLLNASFALVDTLMVGRLGDEVLSGVGMAGQWNWLLSMVLFGICSGAAVLISQFWGIGDRTRIRGTVGASLLFGCGVVLLFLLPAALAPHAVLSLFTREQAVLPTAAGYLRIACFSYPALMLSLLLNTALRSTEDVRTPMYVSMVSALANVALNYMLIFGHCGLPEMGARGAALATCISAWLAPVILISISLCRRNILHGPLRELFSFRKAEWTLFLRRTLPVVCNESMWGLGTFLFSLIFANLGYENYAAVTIFRTFEEISFVIFIGLCNACSVMVGKRVGCGQIGDAVRTARRFAVLEPLLALGTGLITVLLREPLVGIFNLGQNLSAYTSNTAAQLLLIYGCESALRNLPYIQIVGIFRSGGDTKSSMLYDLGTLWFLSLPLTLLTAFVWKLPFPVVFASMYLAEDIPKAILCTRHFLSGRWLKPVTEIGQRGLTEWLAKKNAS